MTKEFFGETNVAPATERAADRDELTDTVLDTCPEPLRSKLLAARREELERRHHGRERNQVA
jgi:hypothetical protein